MAEKGKLQRANREEKNEFDASVLFFDIHGYGRLNETQIKAFHERIWPQIYSLAAGDIKDEFLQINTWGDGIILIHKNASVLVKIALALQNYFNNNQYLVGNPLFNEKELRARIAIHKQKVYKVYDPFRGLPAFVGRGIIRAARIEPATPRGSVWISKIAKMTLEQELDADEIKKLFRFKPQKKMPLTKEMKAEEVYEVIGLTGKFTPVNRSEKDFRLTKDKSSIIRNLIRADPIKNKLHLCHNGEEEEAWNCNIPCDSLCLISDMLRSSSSRNETLVLIGILKNFKVAISARSKGSKIGSVLDALISIKINIDSLYNFFNNLEREPYAEDKNIPIAKRNEIRMRKFLKRRAFSKNIKNFLIFANIIKSTLKELDYIDTQPGEKSKEILKRIRSSEKFNEAIRVLPDILEEIINKLGKVADDRETLVTKNVRESFINSNRTNIIHKYSSSYESMPHRNGKPLPQIWRTKRKRR